MSNPITAIAGATLAFLAASTEKNQPVQVIPDCPKLRHWSKVDDAPAMHEGWGLWEVDGRYQLQRVDDPSAVAGLDFTEPKFESDADALGFVVLKAMAGSEFHAEALHNIGALAG